MRRLALAIAAAAVVAPPAAADQRGSSRLEWLLGTRLTGTRVRLGAKPQLRWRADGATTIADAVFDEGDAFSRLRGDTPGAARIVIGGRAVKLAAYVRQRDLAPVVRRATLLHPSRTRAGAGRDPGTPGVHLDPGARIDPGRRRGGFTAAAIKLGAIEARGLVDTAAVDVEFVPKPASASPPDGEWRQIKPPLVLRDRPGGGPQVARLVGDGSLISVRLLESRGTHALIACEEEGAIAVGWVSARRLLPGEGSVWGALSGMGYGAHRIRLLEGTVLSERAGGEPIGLMTGTAWVRSYGKSGTWVEVDVETEVGALRVWASSDRMQSGDDPPTP